MSLKPTATATDTFHANSHIMHSMQQDGSKRLKKIVGRYKTIFKSFSSQFLSLRTFVVGTNKKKKKKMHDGNIVP